MIHVVHDVLVLQRITIPFKVEFVDSSSFDAAKVNRNHGPVRDPNQLSDIFLIEARVGIQPKELRLLFFFD